MKITFKIFTLILAISCINQAAVTTNQITTLTNDNLVYSGTIAISPQSNLFFTYYGADGVKDQSSLKQHPLLVFVGNPGCSAQYYGIASIGPVKLNQNLSFVPNANRFTNVANLMFIDLLGSGFSFTSNVSNLPSDLKTFGVQLTTALNLFISQSPLGKSSTLILAGEGSFIRTLPGLNDVDPLKGIIHFSTWPEMYAMGRYYGVAGVELKILVDSQRIAIESTFTSCYNYIRNSKFLEAHQCLDTIFNFVENKTKNANLFDVRLYSNLTDFLPLVQYYFSQTAAISAWKAPTARLFQSQSGYVGNLTYVDQAKNYTKDISTFMKDYFSVKHWFVGGLNDFISFSKGLRNWIETELSFVESDAFKKAKLQDIVIDGNIVGYAKSVKQIAYSQIINSGHHVLFDDPSTVNYLLKNWVGSLGEGEDSEDKHISTE